MEHAFPRRITSHSIGKEKAMMSLVVHKVEVDGCSSTDASCGDVYNYKKYQNSTNFYPRCFALMLKTPLCFTS